MNKIKQQRANKGHLTMPKPQPAEGPMRPRPNERRWWSERETAIIKSKRLEMIGRGLTDLAIAKNLSDELQRRSMLSISGKMNALIRAGELRENPNKQKQFSEAELGIIRSRRAELINEGLTDSSISKRLTKDIPARLACTISSKIGNLIKSGKLEENPNRQAKQEFTQEELELIESKRRGLMTEGLTDRAISRNLSKELPKRSEAVVRGKIKSLLRSGKLKRNPNRIENFTEDELRAIRLLRSGLIRKGLTDGAIAGRLEKELPGRSMRSIESKIIKLIRLGVLKRNQNKQGSFTSQEIDAILSRRAELIREGATDNMISRILSKELLGRSAGTLDIKIRMLKRRGSLGENPNKRKGFTEAELRLIESRRADMIRAGLTDWDISVRLSKEIQGRSMRAIDQKIRNLVRSGKIGANPNTRISTDAESARAQIEELLDRLQQDSA